MTIARTPAEALQPVHQANAVTGESPYWDCGQQTLWWIDIQGQRLLGFTPSTGRQQCWNLPSLPGLVAGRRSGGLVIGLEDGLYGFDPERGLGERLIAVEAADLRTRVNDGKPDQTGRLWFGTMDKTGSGEAIGALYRLDPDGCMTAARRGVGIPNAICFSPDGRIAYFADSRTRIVEARDYDPVSGEAGPSRPFVSYPQGEVPDGASVDSEGCLWIAVVGGSRIERRTPDGNLDAVIELPVSRPTMAVLGGHDGRSLFITSQRRFLTLEGLRAEPVAGDLLQVRVAAVAAAETLASI